MNIVAIIQARMASTRLPGKVLAKLGDRPLLAQVVNRASRARLLNTILVATSTSQSDDAIKDFCEAGAVRLFRGSEQDVLDRYYQAAKFVQADVVVRLTADCPLLDPAVIDKVVEVFTRGDFDYVANVLVCTYPDGLDTEVFSFPVLERAWREAQLSSEREHVTPYMRNHPDLFRLKNVTHSEDLSSLRWTVDEPRDLEFARAIYARFGEQRFDMNDVLKLLRDQPDLAELNSGIARNEGYSKSLQEDAVVRHLEA
ncbi:MAG TPA: glycosyltransferase family protein [Pyrinomonadaceae bacterium]|jgi:spore coat polysaccharide biosynthesis protein SpsF (cytidylyltransferase family)|nr:glycosyltransferase family protein [Pyrinomonadaceae bacterium]